MIRQGFHVGRRDWYVMAYYDIRTAADLEDAHEALLAAGCAEAETATEILARPDTGYTYTDFGEHLTIILVSHATSAEQMYDTIQHELKHATEHIGEYYGVPPRSEQAAYLQGEIARQMFAAAVFAVCPRCNGNL